MSDAADLTEGDVLEGDPDELIEENELLREQLADLDDGVPIEEILTDEELAWARAQLAKAAQKFDKDQPRAPDGKWTDASGGNPLMMTREAYLTPYTKLPEKDATPEETDRFLAEMDVQRGERKRWDRAVGEAVSEGRMTPALAEERGLYSVPGGWKPLPETLYHVTTAREAVMAEGFKTREQLGQEQGAGLGGGESETISFTADPDVAEGIYRGIVEARRVARGELTIEDMVKAAKEGTHATEPFFNDFERNATGVFGGGLDLLRAGRKVVEPGSSDDKAIRGNLKLSSMGIAAKDIPPGGQPLGEGWQGRDEHFYHGYTYPLTEDEKIDRAFSAYKAFTLFREAHGGPLDPLFFLSDPKKLAATNPRDIAIIEAKAEPGAMGYQQSALGEWRTRSGKAVRATRAYRALAKADWMTPGMAQAEKADVYQHGDHDLVERLVRPMAHVVTSGTSKADVAEQWRVALEAQLPDLEGILADAVTRGLAHRDQAAASSLRALADTWLRAVGLDLVERVGSDDVDQLLASLPALWERAVQPVIRRILSAGAILSMAAKFDESQARDDHGRWTSGGTTGSVNVPGVGDVTVTLHPVDAKDGYRIAWVDTAKFDAAWSRDAGFYIGPGGTKNAISDRYARFKQFLQDKQTFQAPNVGLENGVRFGDGRHRYAVLRDLGVTVMPIALKPEDLARARARGLLVESARKYPEDRPMRLPPEDQTLGEMRYRIVLADDEVGSKTGTPSCELCNYIADVGSFALRDAVMQLDQFLEAAGGPGDMDVERMTEDTPWVPFDQVDGLGVEELTALGVIMPPLHAHCRCGVAIT